MQDKHILYGAELSLFSGKARAYLRWKSIDFDEIPPSQDIYRNEIIPAVGYPVIPVVKTIDGTYVQDTTDIIDYFEKRVGGPSVYPDTPKQHLAALLLELYGDEWLVIPAMHYRWNYNKQWVVREFGAALMPDAGEEAQLKLGEKVSAPFQGFVPLLGVTKETIPGIEKSYEALLGELDAHFSKYDYLFGGRPSIGDFGLIGPLYAHLYRDPKSGELMKKLAPKVGAWVERMQNPPTPLEGDFLPGDVIPDTLLPILKRAIREQFPVLKDAAEKFTAWNAMHKDDPLPRAIGLH
ncbi:MAG: glutathione S-transferase, partial [Sphingomonadales bacterium]